MLQWQDIEVPFAGGLSGKEAKKISQGPLVLENANFDEAGAINKRPTYAATAKTGARNIISRGDFPLLYVTQTTRMPTLSAYNAMTTSFDELTKCLNCKVSVDRSVLGFTPTSVDIRTLDSMVGPSGSNQMFYAHQGYLTSATFDTLSITTKDATTGQVLDLLQIVGDHTSGRFVKVGTWGHIFAKRAYAGAAIGEVVFHEKAVATTWRSNTTRTMGTGCTHVPWDVCYWYDDKIAVIWLNAAHHIQITTWDISAAAQESTVDTTIEVPLDCCISIWSDEHATTPKLVVMYENIADHKVKAMVYDKDLTRVVAPVTLYTMDANEDMLQCAMALKPDASATTICYAFSYSGLFTQGSTVIGEFDYSAGSGAEQEILWFSRLASKMATIGYETYFWVLSEMDISTYGTNIQPGAFLMSKPRGITTPVTGSIAPREIHAVAYALSGYAHELKPDVLDYGKLQNLSLEALDSGTACYRLTWVTPYTTTSSSSDIKSTAGVSVVLNNLFQHATIDRNHLVTGGFVGSVGNKSYTENGFLQYPKIDALAAGSGGMSNGTYSVVVVFEYIDENGQLHRSAPSLPVAITLVAGGAAQGITCTVRTHMLGHPGKYKRCQYVAYRTLGGGTVYYNTGCYAVPTSTVRITTITLTPPDSVIDDYQTLYTTGGVLDAIAPPAPVCIAKTSDRVFALSGDDRSEVWYSKPKEEGVAIEFSDSNVIRFPEPLESIAYYGAVLYGFSKGKYYAVGGEGPNALGQGGQFSIPQLQSSVVGCENPYSFAETPAGLMFQSQMSVAPIPSMSPSATASPSAGMWLIGQNGAQPVLAPDDFSFYPISSARNLPKKNQVVFTLWGYSGANALLTFDYVAQQWATHVVTEAGSTYPIGDVVTGKHQIVNGAYSYLQGVTFAAADVMKIRTPWIKPGGMVSGYGRVRWIYLMGTYKSAHTLNIRCYYDDDDVTAVETKTAVIAASQVPYLYRFKPARQRCNAIMLEIYDSAQTTPYESFSLDGIMLSVGRKPKQVMSAARTI